MIYKRTFLIFLCFWMSLHAMAGTLSGCDFVDRSTTKNATANLVTFYSTEHPHCKENASDNGVASEEDKTNSLDAAPSTSDCDSCNLHCSTVTMLSGVDESIALNNFKEKFTLPTTPTDDSIYLDLPHRPPLARS